MPTVSSYAHRITQPVPISIFGTYVEQPGVTGFTNLNNATGTPDNVYSTFLLDESLEPVTDFYSPVLAGNLTAGTFNISTDSTINSINYQIKYRFDGGDLVSQVERGNLYIAGVWDGATRYSSLTGTSISSVSGITQNAGDVTTSLTFTNNFPPISVINSTLGVRFQGYYENISSSGSGNVTIKVDSILVTVSYTDASSQQPLSGTAAFDTNYRKVFVVNGSQSDSYILNMGVSSGTSQDWSAGNMSVGYLSWNVPGPTGYVLLQWENTGTGGTHTTFISVKGSSNIDFKEGNMNIKNTAPNPSGNIRVVPSIPSGTRYSVIGEFIKPYNGLPH